jgi:hypothetical protein
MRRLLVLTIAVFALLPGVAAARGTITYTLEYTGAYAFHASFDSTTGPSATEDERFTTCFNGTQSQTEHLELTGHIAVGLGWSGPSLFVRFPDGVPPALQQPGTPLKPARSPRTTPTVDIPPKVPQPPTQGAGDPPLVSIGVTCPRTSKACPVQVKVTAGRTKLASRRFTGLEGGVTALAGLKLSKLKLGQQPRKVKVAVAVRTGRTTHRGSRLVTLSR